MGRRAIALSGAVVLVVVLVVGALALRGGTDDPTSDTTTPITSPPVTSPYDLTEAGDDVDLDTLAGAKFASLLLQGPDGPTAYMVAAGQEEFAALAAAVADAGAATDPAPATADTLTFVMPDRSTVTFELAVADGLIARAGKVWRVGDGLADLVRAVTVQAAPPTSG